MHRFFLSAATFAAGIVLSASGFAQVATTGTDFLPAGGFVDYPFQMNGGQVVAMMTTSIGNLPTNFLVPDTRLDIRNPIGTVITSNDDGAVNSVLNGASVTHRGSIGRYFSTTTASPTMRVRGFGATDTGVYCWTKAVFTPGVTAPDFFEVEGNNTLATATPIAVGVNQAVYGRADLAAGENDYYSIPMLPGDVLSFMIVPTQSLPTNFTAVDTRLDARSLADVIITSNDDAGTGSDAVNAAPTIARGSAMRWYSGTATTAIFTVRGFGATDSGTYEMIVSRQNIIPEPGTVMLAVLGLGAGLVRRRRS